MVHTLHTGNRVNGTDLAATRMRAERFAELAGLVLHDYPQPTFLIDPVEPIAVDRRVIAQAVMGLPDSHRRKLLAGQPHDDSIAYIAGHVQMHDTQARLEPLRQSDPAPIEPRRIISIGAQSERPFYYARMTCRQAGLAIPDSAAETGQLFTRHVLPPYLPCREGEPDIEALRYTIPLRQPLEWIEDPLYGRYAGNASIDRDLAFLGRFLAARSSQTIHHQYIGGLGHA